MQAAAGAFAHEGEAADWLDAALGHLAATDWTSLGTTAHGDMLRRLQRAQAKLTAVNAAVLAAFTAGQGYEPDGHRSAVQWLVHRTGMSKGAALGAYGWHKRLARHGVIAAAMTDGTVSESWAKAIAQWTDPLPAADRDEADRILLEAAAAGVPLQDLEILARSIWETWKAQHPDPDDGNGEPGDEDGFEDRRLRLGVTFGGAGKLTGDLAAGCAAKLQAIFDALGKHLGADDWRSVEQRQHDALDEALSRLIKSGLLPQSAGHRHPRPGDHPVRRAARPARRVAGRGAVDGRHRRAARLADRHRRRGRRVRRDDRARWSPAPWTGRPPMTMTQVWIDAHGLDRGREPCGCSCGGCTCQPARPAGRRGEGPAAAHPAGDGRRRDVRPDRAGRLPAVPAAGRPVQQREPAAGRGPRPGHPGPHPPRGHPARQALRLARRLRRGPRRIRGAPPRTAGPRAARPAWRT